MIVTRGGFSQVVGNAFAGMGLPAEAATVYEFPIRMFLPDSDLTPLSENIDKIVYGLTKWQPKIKTKGVYPTEKVTVTGKDYQEAVANMNLLFLKNMWADGLPLLPATEERVNWLLTGTDLPRDKIVGAGKILPRGGIATVESLAVALAMAGGRPEYLPVLIAAVEGFTDPQCMHQSWNATTCSTAAGYIVSGPVANQIRLNSGYGCLGPDPNYPAGATIGRAIRIMLMDMGGAIPGIGTMSIFGGSMRYTGGPVWAEDEAGLPPGWKPLSVDQGFPAGSNIITVNTYTSFNNSNGGSTTTEEVARQTLSRVASYMRAAAHQYQYQWNLPAPGLVLMGRNSAVPLAALGWSKDDVKKFLWENSKIPLSELKKCGITPYGAPKPGEVVPDPYPITSKWENMRVAVCGGSQSGHFYWMGVGYASQGLVSREIKLPAKAKWDALLAQAEKDLGPIPAPMAG